MRRLTLCACSLLGIGVTGGASAQSIPPLLPQPRTLVTCAAPLRLQRPLRFPAGFDPGALDVLRERWTALGIPAPERSHAADVVVQRVALSAPEAYRLDVDARGVRIAVAGTDGVFAAATTLAQLAEAEPGGMRLPCVHIDDAPALRWRIVSDDVSRGPLPTMRYFAERIRTLAAMKINGYSPYMEHVFADPAHPIVAPADPITPAQLRELHAIAARYHVALIPEQQTFAHMHETLKWEDYAGAAELPHGFLLSPAQPQTYAYLDPLVREVLAASAPAPFFHLGADEPVDLGRGRTHDTGGAFAAHVRHVAALIGASARPMIWDDAVQRDPSILAAIPKNVVIVDFHYGAERSFAPYLARVAAAGFEQMAAPGAANWREIYPDIDTATANVGRFVADAKTAHVLGMFMTVWHDDGESLYEATWYPLAFAAASAWQSAAVDPASFPPVFARAFFGTSDPRYARAVAALAAVRTRLHTSPDADPGDYLFWSDPFDRRIAARVAERIDLPALRLAAEGVYGELRFAAPPLHRNAAAVMALAALRYDTLGRRFQIAAEARAYYDDARSHAGSNADAIVYRGLNVAKYLCWELRDEMTSLAPQYAAAWRYESRTTGLENVLTRYRLEAERATERADRLDTVQREEFYRGKTLPAFDDALGLSR